MKTPQAKTQTNGKLAQQGRLQTFDPVTFLVAEAKTNAETVGEVSSVWLWIAR